MKTKIKNNTNCECFFEVEIPNKMVQEITKLVYARIRKYAKIPGFRMGNAPQDLLEKYHGEQAKEEVLKRLIPDGYRRALEEHKITPVSLPEITDVLFEKDRNLTFKAKVEVHPQFKLKKYKGIRVKAGKVKVDDSEVDDTLKRLREMNAKFEPVTDRKNILKNDYLICDVEAFVDGKAISKKHENMWIEANKEASMLGLGEHLVGLTVGQDKEIAAKLPEKYSDIKYAGKDARFKVLVKEIKEKKLPSVDDELAKDMGKESLDNLKDDLKQQLLQKKEANRKINIQNQILDKLLKDHRVAVPSSMVKRQFEVLEKRVKDEMLSRGIHEDAAAGEVKKLEAKLRLDAENKVKVYFILDAVAEKEDIKVNSQDIDERFKTIAHMSQQDLKTVRRYYETNNLMEGLAVQIREEKTLGVLYKEAEVIDEK